jgi:hypothetical protein
MSCWPISVQGTSCCRHPAGCVGNPITYSREEQSTIIINKSPLRWPYFHVQRCADHFFFVFILPCSLLWFPLIFPLPPPYPLLPTNSSHAVRKQEVAQTKKAKEHRQQIRKLIKPKDLQACRLWYEQWTQLASFFWYTCGVGKWSWLRMDGGMQSTLRVWSGKMDRHIRWGWGREGSLLNTGKNPPPPTFFFLVFLGAV